MKILFLSLLLAASVHVSGQEIRPYFSAIFVSNIDSSIAWYNKILGTSLRDRTDTPERGVIQASLFNRDMLVELIQLTSSIGADSILKNYPPRTTIRGFVKMGFIVTDINALWNRLKNEKIKFEGRMVTDRVSNKKTFLVKDPDDNLIQFFEQ
jgi:catechol 2,3-dioxygenase-like lactoylglutathione lyase family enzyme